MEERTKIILVAILFAIIFIAFVDFLLATWRTKNFRKQMTIGDRVKYWKNDRVYCGRIKSFHGDWCVIGELNDDVGYSVHIDNIFKP